MKIDELLDMYTRSVFSYARRIVFAWLCNDSFTKVQCNLCKCIQTSNYSTNVLLLHAAAFLAEDKTEVV